MGRPDRGKRGRQGERDRGHFALVRYAHLNLADHGSLTFNDYMTLSDQERKVVPAKLEC